MNSKQKGFSTLYIVLLLLVIGIAGGAGWYIHHQQTRNTSSGNDQSSKNVTQTESKSQSQSQSVGQPSQKEYFDFVDGKVKFDDDDTWKIATGGYWSNELQRCGRGTDKDVDCLDTQMLIPSEDTFTNADQFQVNISVFNKRVALEDLRPTDTDIQKDTAFSLPRYNAEKYHVKYVWVYPEPDEPSKRTTYLLQTDQYTIKVHSIFFNGNHSSFKSNKDYYPYEAKVDALVRTVQTD